MIEKKTQKYSLLDILFFVLWIATQYFTRNLFCQLLMVVFCACVGMVLLKRSPTRKRTSFFFWYAMFILYGFIQIQFGDVINQSVATTMVRSLLLNLIMIYVLVQYILWKNDLCSFLKLVEWGTFIVAFVVVLLSWRTIASDRLGGGTEINANMLAMLCVYGLILGMYLSKNGEHAQVYKVKMLLYVAFVLLTGSRKGLLMIVLSVFIINVLSGKRKIVKNLLSVAAIVLVLYFLIMNIDFLYNIIGVRVESLLEFVSEGSTEEGSLKSRQLLIETGWEYIKRKPWTGYGYDCFKLISGIGGSGNYDLYSHNNYIELLFGGGIIGLVLYYIPFVFILIGLIKHIKTDPCITYIIAILVSKLAVEYAYVSYYSRIDAYITAIILGCLLICKNKAATKATDSGDEGQYENIKTKGFENIAR